MKAIDRLYQYIERKGIKPTRLEKEVGLSNGYLGTQLKRGADLGESILNRIIDYCLDINPEWLLTGKGEMLRHRPPDSPGPSVSAESDGARFDRMLGIIEEQAALIKEQSGRIEKLLVRINELSANQITPDKGKPKAERRTSGRGKAVPQT